MIINRYLDIRSNLQTPIKMSVGLFNWVRKEELERWVT
tara:strand:- start:1404 stop:1517 length:114 start_codon:yes stop_codon:yes gene_type:complete